MGVEGGGYGKIRKGGYILCLGMVELVLWRILFLKMGFKEVEIIISEILM